MLWGRMKKEQIQKETVLGIGIFMKKNQNKILQEPGYKKQSEQNL